MMDMSEIVTAVLGNQVLYGVDIGFWVGMVLCAVVVLAMHIVYWGVMKPYQH